MWILTSHESYQAKNRKEPKVKKEGNKRENTESYKHIIERRKKKVNPLNPDTMHILEYWY